MLKSQIPVVNASILIMGLSFKENCPDLRNTKVADIIAELKSYSVNIDVYDPWVIPEDAQHEYGVTTVREPTPGKYDAIILAVAHDEFRAIGGEKMHAYGKPVHVLYDLKYMLPKAESDMRL
jgi:UDP-N-acetyl-D-galactosamine dehydrogenase